MSNGQLRKWTVGLGILCAAVLLQPAAARAQEDANQLKAELQAQRQRQAELEDRINQLEARQKLKERAAAEKTEQAAAPAAEEKKPEAIPESLKWASKLNWYGDLRYRYEFIDDDSTTSDRHRNRIRARLGLDVKVSDEWNLGFRLATGNTESNGISGDPISTNQTLDEAFSKKPIWLDLAFFGYHPAWFKGLDVFGGKINMPFFKPGRVGPNYSEFLTFEGISVEDGRNYYMNATVAYRQACLNAINYLMPAMNWTFEQAYLFLGAAPVDGRIGGVVDIPNSAVSLSIPLSIFDRNLLPEGAGGGRELVAD